MNFVVNFFHRRGSRDSPTFIWLISLVSLVVILGLVMVLSSSSIDSLKSSNNPFGSFLRQLLFVGLGFLAMLTVSRLNIALVYRYTPFAYFASLVLQLLVFSPLGVSVKGNTNWIGVFGFSIQPSEFFKLTMILVCARLIEMRIRSIDDVRMFTWPVLALGAAGIALVIGGKDLGTSLIIAMILFGMLLLSGVSWQAIKVPLMIGAVGVSILVAIGGSRIGRIQAWLGTGDGTSPYDWQSEHGIWAVAAGHFNGVGLGNSKLKWTWIPEVETDYIFAIIGEEWGWIGAVLFIIFFLILANLMRRVAIESDTLFKRMTVTGIMVWITIQAFVNIAVVLRLLPVLGVPLPLVSYGGSSLLSSMLAIGLVLAIDRDNHGLVAQPLRMPRRVRAR